MSTPATNHPGLTTPVSSPSPKKKTPAQVRRIAERRRERKAEQRPERERNALALAQELMFLSDREGFTPWRFELLALASQIRLSGKRTPDRDVEAVKRALGTPLCYSLVDIAAEANLPEREVLPILEGLLTLGVVERRPAERPGTARGPHELGWFLTGKPPRSPLVLP
jgi:hypothetical protein